MAKRLIVCASVLVSCLCALLCGCIPKTEYDNKTIAKIETSSVSFMPKPSYQKYDLREIDFQSGTVVDTLVADFTDANEEELQYANIDAYNNPKVVTTFSNVQGRALLEKIKSLGFLAWKEEYVTKDPVCDGGSNTVKVYFTDGTVKSTYIFIKKPPQYDKIYATFKNCLGIGMYCGDGPTKDEVSTTRRFEFHYAMFKPDYYADYSEMGDVVELLKNNVALRDKEAFFAYADSLKSNANSGMLVCPFLFSSSEEGVFVSDVTTDSNTVYVTFNIYSPELLDDDMRMYVFFVNASNLPISKDESLRVEYIINNLAGGKGSYYYR